MMSFLRRLFGQRAAKNFGDKPDTFTGAGEPGEAEISWLYASRTPDGRSFLLDHAFVIEVNYLKGSEIPREVLPYKDLEFLFNLTTTHEFRFNELSVIPSSGNYSTPDGVVLSKKYIDYIRRSIPMYERFLIRTAGSFRPMTMVDGEKAIGWLMPVKE